MLVLAAVAGMANAAQAQDIEINDTNFPDENFRTHVKQYDTNSDGSLSNEEIAAVTIIDVSNKNITNLEGIEHFTALTKLNCYNNQLTTLDVSKNTALTDLSCSNNQLTALNVSANTALEFLICSNNQLTAFNVSANTALEFLICGNNQLTALDVSKNTALTTLDCYSNQLTTLDVSNNTALKNLNCYNNQLTTLDVSNNTALERLDCRNNQLTTLDVSANTALKRLDCHNNQLTALNVSANIALTTLYCYGNQIQGDEMLALVNSLPTVTSGWFYVVDMQNSNEGNVITKSQVAIATEKKWKVYDYNNNNAVEYAGAPGIKINDTNFPDANFRTLVDQYDTDRDGSLSDTEIAAVTSMYFSAQNIADFKGIEHFTALKVFQCARNQLTVLDVSVNTALTELVCHENQLTALDVSKNTALTTLACDNNQLTALDVSANTALEQLDCYDNQLTALDVSANIALWVLDCANNQLTTLDVSANTALEWLECNNNQLTTLDVSKNTALERLNCGNNQLTTLDVSANTELEQLSCGINQLTTLDVSANTALTELACFSNQIQADEMLALVNSLPTVTNGEFYVVDTQDSDEGNVITKAQVAIAQSKGWTVYGFNGIDVEEYAGVEEYVLTLGNPTNGTLTATPNGSVGEGTAVIITATPNEGYKLKALKAYKTGDESQTVAISENKFTMPPYDVTVEAEFEAITYTLTYTAGEGGTIVGSTSQSVAQGGSGTEVEAKPNEGYKFVKWSDGRTTAKRTDSNVQANLSVKAEFEKNATTGLFDTQLDALSVYPNPTAGQLWGSVPELAEGTAAEVLVYNASGHLLQRVAARAASTGSAAAYGRISIDLSSYPAGVYIIQVGNAVAKVLKQ